MSQHSYTYIVVRYVPDRGANEALNIGVVMYSERVGFLREKIDSKYERLSQAFANFDGAAFRRAVMNLRLALKTAEQSLENAPLLRDDRSFTDWLRTVMPDTGSALTFSDPRHGIAEDLSAELMVLFDRMVESQRVAAEERPRRDDAQVWRTYAEGLPAPISQHLKPKSFSTSSVKVEFEHAIKNGAWHVIQPVSMDFKRAESMQRKASEWVGKAVGLQGVSELGTIFFLLGAPDKHGKSYARAKALLNQAPVRHEIVEESDAERLNRRLLQLMQSHDE